MSVIDEIAAERRRQIEVEGWTAEHDDRHRPGDLAAAGACYAQSAYMSVEDRFFWTDIGLVPIEWPWGRAWWKPTTARRDLIKAAALIVAEIERMDRESRDVT